MGGGASTAQLVASAVIQRASSRKFLWCEHECLRGVWGVFMESQSTRGRRASTRPPEQEAQVTVAVTSARAMRKEALQLLCRSGFKATTKSTQPHRHRPGPVAPQTQAPS